MGKHLETEAESYIDKRNLLLKDIEPKVIRKAWFTLSHLLLEEGSHVIDMGCDDGAMTYAMAAMNPKVKFTGLDKAKRQINKAKEKYKLFNLDYKVGDSSRNIFEEESVDAIINSYILHEIYSASRYNERIVAETIRTHFKALKKGGVMFIRDYARPPPGEFVLMEIPDEPSKGKALSNLSDADLLIWYAEHARPKQDAGCGGFFLEELPERFPRTRLFRLPYKWAYEFIMRKDQRQHWESELPIEYTFFTMREFRKELGGLGARVQYSGPFFDDDIINEKFEGRFRLYSDDGVPLGNPPTCYIAVAYKMAERKSLEIQERRPSMTESGNLNITAMRNEKTGQIVDVVSRELDVSEVIPYRVDEEGRLKVYLHDGIARSITNAVPRGGINIDGRRWSGHMIEPITVDGEALSKMEQYDVKNTVLFARDYLGVKPDEGSVLEHGPDYYPAPDYIDEKIKTFYVKVKQAKGSIQPKSVVGVEKFQAKGVVREMDAQQILNAITTGMIPNARLELQLLSLFQHLNLRAETWTDKALNLQVSKINNKADIKKLMAEMAGEDIRFKEIKGTTGQLRPVHSTFVEEGQSRGSMSGLTAENVDFIVHDGKTINTAVVLPLTKDEKSVVHAGFLAEHLPVPQRHEGNGLTVCAPSFNIPPEVTNFKLLRKFLAEKFGVTPNKIIKMGESYFTHVGLTPHRIHPYVVAAPAEAMKGPNTKFLPFYQLMLLQRFISKEPHFMLAIARAYRYFHDDLKLDAKRQVKEILKQRFEGYQPDWSIPLNYESIEVLKKQSMEKKRIQMDMLNHTHEEDIEVKVQRKLSEQERKAFHQQVKDGDIKPEEKVSKPKVEEPTYEEIDYSEEDVTPEQEEAFEAELEAFMDTVEKEMEDIPRPEKW
ncbi:MAG: class I SAM-dependent methyltransferase [Alphaproteobacteria bacterium]|nr:class I SAM-dependent methyltransferase [Alphaproteobacteria bacterium]